MQATILILAALFAFHQPAMQLTPSSDADVGAIRSARARLNEAIAHRRFDEMNEALGDDVSSTGPAKRTVGRDSFVRFYLDLVQRRPDLVLAREPQSVRINATWELASESGEWHESWREEGVLTELRGSYFAIWSKVQGRWVLDAETFVPLSCTGGNYCNP